MGRCIVACMRMLQTFHVKWPDRERFLDLVQDYLDRTPKRHAYYPGAAERYRRFSSQPSFAECTRTAEPPSNECILPWTLLRDVDLKKSPHLAQEESFVCVCAETSLEADTPQEFLRKAVRFVNNEVSAASLVNPDALAVISPGVSLVTGFMG